MSHPAQTKVIVRVEVVIDGHEPIVRITPQEPGPIRCWVIDFPPPGQPVLVFPSGTGQFLTSANGTAPPRSGSFPQKVWARAYPSIVDPFDDQFDFPPSNAILTVPNPYNGDWAYGPVIPNCAAAMSPSGPSNTTLIVWYQYAGSSVFSHEGVHFRGYISGSGGSVPVPTMGKMSTSISPMMRMTLASQKPLLYATFTGDLASLGSVKLMWNGTTWSGVSTVSSGSSMSLLILDTDYHFVSVGPTTAFVVSGKGNFTEPFVFSMEGVAVGEISGRFEVTITE
jgi:hypothetical protein